MSWGSVHNLQEKPIHYGLCFLLEQKKSIKMVTSVIFHTGKLSIKILTNLSENKMINT